MYEWSLVTLIYQFPLFRLRVGNGRLNLRTGPKCFSSWAPECELIERGSCIYRINTVIMKLSTYILSVVLNCVLNLQRNWIEQILLFNIMLAEELFRTVCSSFRWLSKNGFQAKFLFFGWLISSFQTWIGIYLHFFVTTALLRWLIPVLHEH